jgi:integrase
MCIRDRLQGDVIRGDALLPRGGRVTLNAFLDEWWPSYERSLKTTSADSEGARVRNHIRPILGEFALDEIDSATVQQWVNDIGAGVGPWVARGRRKPLAPKSVHNAHGLLFVIFAAAIAAKRLRSNPCGSTNLPARVHREMMFLTDPEIARLIRAMPEHWRPLVLLLVATGLRWGEAIGLKAGRVDLLAARPRLLVVEQLQERAGSGAELYFSSPKSARSRRTVSFTKQVALALTPVVAGKREDEVVFTTVTGLMVRTRNFRRDWLKAIERAGLPGLRIHDLRHTHAAILIAANRQLSAISRRLGHSSLAVTDALYGHLREEVDDGIIDAVNAALSQVSAEDLEREIEDEMTDALS